MTTKKDSSELVKLQKNKKPQVVKDQLLDLATVDWEEYYFDEEAANRIGDFAKRFLVHTKGHWAKKPVAFDLWQIRILRTFYGWKKRRNGLRRFRTLYLEVPRKNGKSLIGSVIALYQLYCDHEFGAEVYSAATDKAQAKIVFDTAKNMLDFAPKLKKRVKVIKQSITLPGTMSKYVPLSAEAYTKDGLNASAIIFDELHAQPNRELYDVLRTSMGARLQPVEVYITTAGKDIKSIGFEVHDYAEKVIKGVLKDDSFLGVIYACGEEDNWEDEATWIKANPGWGKSIIPDNFRAEFVKAKNTLSFVNTFKRLYLNIWTGAGQAWIPWEKWRRAGIAYDELSLLGRKCWVALDLSKRVDITAMTLFFPMDDGTYRSLTKFWMPEECAAEREQADRAPYKLWAEQGFLTLTEGDIVDYDVIIEEIKRVRKVFKVQEIALDPWGSTAINNTLQKDGIDVVEFRQGYRSMSPAMKDLEGLILQMKFLHNQNPVMDWMMSNIRIKSDEPGNIKPDKIKSTNRIDGPVSLIMASGRFFVPDKKEKNPYNERGFMQL